MGAIILVYPFFPLCFVLVDKTPIDISATKASPKAQRAKFSKILLFTGGATCPI
ncbi:hypothetical protein FB479_103224 [Brevibacillus sp. AG162]|nr:hypothetical protein FB479_103224 [Brevibacillus sp. AG162]